MVPAGGLRGRGGAVMLWTILALDENTGETIAAHVEAPDAFAAVTGWATENTERDCCVVIGAVEGHVQLHPPCESGASAYVADLAEKDTADDGGVEQIERQNDERDRLGTLAYF